MHDNNVGADETLFHREGDLNACGIRIAPGEGRVPKPLFQNTKAEVLSFPTIYGGHDRNFKRLKVSYTDIAKSELRKYDRRACRPSKLLYSFKRSFNEKVYKAMQLCMRKNAGRVKASTLRRPGYIQNLLRKDQGYAVFKKLRSSPSYYVAEATLCFRSVCLSVCLSVCPSVIVYNSIGTDGTISVLLAVEDH